MLHLAQITFDPQKNCRQLTVMASCQPHQSWQRNDLILPLVNGEAWSEGSLIVVETDAEGKVQLMTDGVDWLLALLPPATYLDLGQPSLSLIEQEKQRLEAWRQEMAAKNLELTRQQIELETQRQQLREQEMVLKRHS